MYQATKLGDQAIIKIDGEAEKLLVEIVRQNAQVLAINADLLSKLSLSPQQLPPPSESATTAASAAATP